jgi:hypothetical protein
VRESLNDGARAGKPPTIEKLRPLAAYTGRETFCRRRHAWVRCQDRISDDYRNALGKFRRRYLFEDDAKLERGLFPECAFKAALRGGQRGMALATAAFPVSVSAIRRPRLSWSGTSSFTKPRL